MFGSGRSSDVVETPEFEFTSHRSAYPGRSYAGMAINALNSAKRDRVPDSDDESELGDLMVMTDDEDEEREGGGRVIPDTPTR